MTNLRVNKTLLIGLGSTGTRILDAVAGRVRWELGDWSRAPWLEYLCIETDEAEKSKMQNLGAEHFRALTIAPNDFGLMVESPAAFDSTIDLRRWMDPATIQKLPGSEVNAGVGNIRMLGRLTLLHQPNFQRVADAVNERVTRLQNLSEAAATQTHGPLLDGSQLDITFNDDSIRVIVVGTLCGGTCSGLASDFGYFLRNRLKHGDRLTALFTLPHPQLTNALTETADRFKKNAYHALVELNHYHLSGRQNEPPIRCPDRTQADTTKFPYDLTFLLMPKTVGTSGELQLNQALADRIFLDAFAPETDIYGDAVNAAVFGQGESVARTDRDHRAHVFCTLGLSTMEFPAQRVIEACMRRVLASTLARWGTSSPDDARVEELVDTSLGISWEGFRTALMQLDGAAVLEGALDQKQREVARLLGTDVDAGIRSLAELREALSGQSTGSTELFAKGGVAAALRRSRQGATERVRDRIRTATRSILTDVEGGPSTLIAVLTKARQRVSDLRSIELESYAGHQQKVERSLEVIRSHRANPLLAILGLTRAAVRAEVRQLQRSLSKEVEARLQTTLFQALQNDTAVGGSEGTQGLLERVDRVLTPALKRANNLRSRVVALRNKNEARADELARTAPSINGLAIFTPEVGSSGTVQDEYRRAVVDYYGDPSMTWEEARDRFGRELVREWEHLAKVVVPPPNKEDDWLMAPFRPMSEGASLPIDVERAMERQAVRPFGGLVNVDVLERWRRGLSDGTDPDAAARQAAQLVAPFLDVNQVLAQLGGRSPVPIRRFVLTPASSHANEFRAAVAGTLTNPKHATSPESFRTVMLEEWYRFPLSAAPSILGTENSSSLQNARCNDFPTFWTRKDIGWTGISEPEIQAARLAEELLSLNVLLQQVELRNSAIHIRTQSKMGDDGIRQLPLHFQRATRMLADGSLDLAGRAMPNVLNVLDNNVRDHVRGLDADPYEAAMKLAKDLDRNLQNGVGRQVEGWSQDAAAEYVYRYMARDEHMFTAYKALYAPGEAVLNMLRRQPGDANPGGGELIKKAGLYCPSCGGLIGETEREAARNGWRCFINPEKHHLDSNFGIEPGQGSGFGGH